MFGFYYNKLVNNGQVMYLDISETSANKKIITLLDN